MVGSEELIGPDVNLVFRLAKNTIKKRLGVSAYVAYTTQAIEALGLPEFTATLSSLNEGVDDFGELKVYVADMHDVWKDRRYESLLVIRDGDVVLSFTRDIKAPFGRVWAHLTVPPDEAGSSCQSRAEPRRARAAAWARAVPTCAHTADAQAKPVFLHKFTGWPRAGFAHAIFPEARFRHVIRDGRAVANSLIQMSWWSGFGGPENWKWGQLSDEDLSAWKRLTVPGQSSPESSGRCL